jgi:hypothetical protein
MSSQNLNIPYDVPVVWATSQGCRDLPILDDRPAVCLSLPAGSDRHQIAAWCQPDAGPVRAVGGPGRAGGGPGRGGADPAGCPPRGRAVR